MCGIVGYTGSDIAKNILVTGLKRMAVSYTHLTLPTILRV